MNEKLDYQRPIEIANGVFWVGFCDEETGLHCNPYLIIDGKEGVIIDGGSRPDFPKVMMKILKTGLKPKAIKALIYQHYDPDLCGSLPNFENIIDSPRLKVISTSENHMFLRHYSADSSIVKIEETKSEFEFSSGRKLKFLKTPYAHAAGSFVTWDEQTGVLFTSDLFGSFDNRWQLFQRIQENEIDDNPKTKNISSEKNSHISGIAAFHRRNFPTVKVLKHAMKVIKELNFKFIAPQHGSILDEKSAHLAISVLENLDNVGIDAFYPEN